MNSRALPLPTALDREGQPLKEGDHVSFVMRGMFLPRGQESFGHIEKIDEYGGIAIKMIAPYKHFLSSKKIADYVTHIYFTHHIYDAEKHARVYSMTQGSHELFIQLFHGKPHDPSQDPLFKNVV